MYLKIRQRTPKTFLPARFTSLISSLTTLFKNIDILDKMVEVLISNSAVTQKMQENPISFQTVIHFLIFLPGTS